jgi:hypothetical protein
MSLRDLVDRKATIQVTDEISFEVRGLSLEDVVLLMENHKDALISIFGKPDGADFQELLRRFPNFIAAAIAYAADEHELEKEVQKMPIGVQLRAMQEVWELSSLDVETLGKLATNLLAGVAELNSDKLVALKEGLKTGSENLPAAQNS